MAEKICFKCNHSKPTSEFYANSRMGDGLFGKCKECTKADVKNNRELKADYYREFDANRAMLPHRIAARAKYQKTEQGIKCANKAKGMWIELNPIKRLAHHALNNAVRDGKLIKPKSCQQCSKTGRIHGHHCDYAKVFDVLWLCPACHMKWHKVNGEAENGG
jgi:hypothetical protein